MERGALTGLIEQLEQMRELFANPTKNDQKDKDNGNHRI